MITLEEQTTLDNGDELSGVVSVLADGDDTTVECRTGDNLPLLALRNGVLFSHVVLPITIGRKKSLRVVRDAYKNSTEIIAVAQRDVHVEDPTIDDLYPCGTVARVIRILEMPDNSISVILHGRKRARLQAVVPGRIYPVARVELVEDIIPKANNREFKALIEAIKELAIHISKVSNDIPEEEMTFAVRNLEDHLALINYICANFPLTVDVKARLLACNSIQERGYQLLDALTKESQLLDIKSSIQSKVRMDIEQQQREYFLQQQMKTIQDELSGGDSLSRDVEALREAAKDKKWSEAVAQVFEKEIKRLERMHPHAPDYPIQQNYIETLVSLPWNVNSPDKFDLKRAQRILDRDHFGLEKVKERIIEHLAVLKLKGDLRSPIICLYGPPGVGKTSLGKSIAEVLGRKYVRMSLGGLHDEAEIRGHRRTYIGAMPGRIIQNLKKVGTSNPVFVLDEIDKVNSDFKGDPASALLEALDPEQNNAFHDNFIDVDYDLSKILFIATANNLDTISQPLLDRMELIEVNGYIPDEKIEIAIRHLVPKQLEAHGITKKQVKFTRTAVAGIIEDYTRESGVRELDRMIAKVLRKISTKIASDTPYEHSVTADLLKTYLGVQRYTHDIYEDKHRYGVVTGLAWTRVGGEILYVESSVNQSKGGKLTLTGNLGDVMKESAMLAMEYIKAHAELLGISEQFLEEHSGHVHVPEGAIPKDGPSAGIAILTALVSTFTKRKVKSRVAMTGEITLRGKVLPVGGIKEKILAAKRAGITDIILCLDNKKDVEEIEPAYLHGLTFHFIREMHEALDLALEEGNN
ncbi:MAG: endopeptidase La [Prevotellaceae bacterium]|jgi:ATP-dependent Lon protease|nr:endopeptidase La [Prevotellaceae bacterium]